VGVNGDSGGGATSVDDFLALGFTPEQAQQAAQAAALFGSGASAGVADKILFGDTGAGGGGFAPPSLQFDVDPKTGEVITFNPRSGQIGRTGETVGFAGIDPRELAAEEARVATNRDALAAAGLRETAGFNRASLAEGARRADQTAALSEFATRANLVPAFGNIALGAAQEQREILSSGKDFLARAFGEAGQDSPLGRVTQSDMINSLMRDLASVERLVPQSRATGRTGFAGAPAFVEAELGGFRGFSDAPTVAPRAAAGVPAFAGAVGDGIGGGVAAPGGFAGLTAPAGPIAPLNRGLPTPEDIGGRFGFSGGFTPPRALDLEDVPGRFGFAPTFDPRTVAPASSQRREAAEHRRRTEAQA
jgi:hypothetical protein